MSHLTQFIRSWNIKSFSLRLRFQAGLDTNSILFCWLFIIKDRCVQKCVFNKRTIKVCVSCGWRCPGTSVAPSTAHLKVSLYLCSSRSNARGELRALEGRRVSPKSPWRGRDGDEGVAGKNGREWSFPDEGSLICPPGKSMIFHIKETEKDWVSGHTCNISWGACLWKCITSLGKSITQ